MYSTQNMVAVGYNAMRVTVTYKRFWDLAEWSERLAVNAKVANSQQSCIDPSILRHSVIWVAAVEAVFNSVGK